MTILRLMLQNSIAGYHISRGQTLDREDDTSTETRKVEGKLDALVKLVTQLARIRSLPLLQESMASVLSITTIQIARNDAIVIRGVHDVSTDTSTETRKVEGKLDALVNLVIQLAVNQKPASVARVCGIRSSNDQHTNTTTAAEARHLIEKIVSNSCSFSSRNDAIVIRGVHDVATDTSAKTRKVEGKLDTLVNFNARNDVIVTRGVHDEAIDRSDETRKVEGKLDALINLVTQLAVNQKPASVARVYGIRFSNDHHTKVCPSSQKPGVNEHPEAYAANNYSRQPQQQRPDT
ncbi:hypothetical protein Fmac_024896 [Flemingia macrophylla]|uniref:Uncharacterized protein n=1 Tax=Flemingia macrophylla TaxID=520843 RepID=A0ABD1LQS8_9FABA